MDDVWVLPPEGEKSMPLSFVRTPKVAEHFHGMNTAMYVFIYICSLITFIVLLTTMRIIWVVHKKVSDEYLQTDFYWVAYMPLVVCLCSLGGNIFPRSMPILYAIGLTYLMLCYQTMHALIMRLAGGRSALAEWLQFKNKRISFTTPPFCCCCKCLPSAEPTARALRLIGYIIEQSPVIRILIEIVLIVGSHEGLNVNGAASQILNGVGVASTLIAVYGCHILIRISEDRGAAYNTKVLFQCVDGAQLAYTLQKFIFDLITKNGAWKDTDMLTAQQQGHYWHNVAMCGWMLLVSGVFYRQIRPEGPGLLPVQSAGERPPAVGAVYGKGAVFSSRL